MERILVAGATGLLGSRIARLLLQQGRPVRALVRDRARAHELAELGAELVLGDFKNPHSLHAACTGSSHVVTTANAFMQKADNTPDRVDVAGTRSLAEAARDAGVRRFLFVSAVVAEPDADVDFYRYKFQAQEAVRASGVPYTIVRPPAFMDVWAEIVLGKARTGGAAMIFGDGKRPVNFIAVDDVARAVIDLLDDPTAANQIVDLRGPDDLPLLEVVRAYEQRAGHPVKRKHIPIAAMRILQRILRPFNPVMSRMMAGGVQIATQTPRFNQPRTQYAQTTFSQWLAQHD